MRPLWRVPGHAVPAGGGAAGEASIRIFTSSCTRCVPLDLFSHRPLSDAACGRNGPGVKWVPAQLTKRRMRTFITRPSDINTNSVADPP